MGELKQTSFRLDEDLHRKVRLACVNRGTNQSVALEEALRLWLESGTGIVQVDDASPAAQSGAKLNKINELTVESSTSNTVVTEAEEWAALASVASLNPSEMHKTLYRNFRFALETLAGVAREVLSLDVKIPVRFAEDGTIKRPHDDPQSPMYADRGSGGTRSTGAGDHRRASGSEAGRHARTAKKRA